jgi:hypothetical protein
MTHRPITAATYKGHKRKVCQPVVLTVPFSIAILWDATEFGDTAKKSTMYT